MASVVAAGWSTGTFALLAGVSLAFMSGGRRVVQGRTGGRRRAAS